MELLWFRTGGGTTVRRVARAWLDDHPRVGSIERAGHAGDRGAVEPNAELLGGVPVPEQGQPGDRLGHQRQHGGEHQHSIEHCAIGQRSELLVSKRHRTREPHPDSRISVEMQLLRDGPDRVARCFSRLQGPVVEHGLNQYETPQLSRIRVLAADQRVP